MAMSKETANIANYFNYYDQSVVNTVSYEMTPPKKTQW
jgi:hypothetical protein